MAADPKKAAAVLKLLKKEYPVIEPALDYRNPLQLLVAVILSAQCTDKQVNKITPELFKRYQTVEDYANAPIPEIESYIRSTGFFHNKAKNIQACARAIVERFGGKIPDRMEDLVTLAGVGRKTANVILSWVFNKQEGVCVDTHVGRLSNLIGLSDEKGAEKVERDLMALYPKKEWQAVTDVLIRHGRNVCIARRPECNRCPLPKLCRYYRTVVKKKD